MTVLTFTVNVVGTPDAEDKRAMLAVIDAENARRTALNNAVPPPNPLWTLLPKSTAAERKSSYETMMIVRMAQMHTKYIRQATDDVDTDTRWRILRAYWKDATEAQKDAVETALGAPVTP